MFFKGTVPVDFGKINKSLVEGQSKFILHGEGGAGRSEKGGGDKAATKDSDTLNYRVHSEAKLNIK